MPSRLLVLCRLAADEPLHPDCFIKEVLRVQTRRRAGCSRCTVPPKEKKKQPVPAKTGSNFSWLLSSSHSFAAPLIKASLLPDFLNNELETEHQIWNKTTSWPSQSRQNFKFCRLQISSMVTFKESSSHRRLNSKIYNISRRYLHCFDKMSKLFPRCFFSVFIVLPCTSFEHSPASGWLWHDDRRSEIMWHLLL